MTLYKNSKKQGDAGLGQAIAYFTLLGYDVALPLTDSADWDLIVEINNELKRVQVKSSYQLSKTGIMKFNANVCGGNMTNMKPTKLIPNQNWDLIFLHHMVTGVQALIPKDALTTKGQINLGGQKYNEYIIKKE